MMTENNGGKAAYAGPTPAGERNGFGVLVERCPTCGGTGKVVDGQAASEALKAPVEYQYRQWTVSLQVQALVERALASIPDSPQEAARLAAAARELAERAGLATVEGSEEFLLSRLRQIRDRHPRLKWEDLRKVAVQIMPSLRRYTHWRAFRMACLRAEKPHETARVWTVQRVWRRKDKRWVYRLRAVTPLHLPSGKNVQEEVGRAEAAFFERMLTERLGPGLACAFQRCATLQGKGEGLRPLSRDLLQCIFRHIERGEREREARGTVSRKTLNEINTLLRLVEEWESPGAEGEPAPGR